MVVRLATAVLLLAVSVAGHAQQAGKTYRIGFVSFLSPGTTFAAFREGLKELGYVEGKNVVIESRFAEGRHERLPDLVDELLRLKVDVLLAASPPAALAAKKATTTVPVVFAGVADPVGRGIVPSLARPGGNITGVVAGMGTSGKLVELLKEAVPGMSRVALLSDPAEPLSAQVVRQIQDAARALKLKVDVLDVGNTVDLDRAFATIGASGVQGMIVTSAPFLFASRVRIADFAASRRLPTVQPSRPFAEAGGLMTYGGSLEASYRRAAAHVDRILKGAKPADLPVEQPMRLEMVINLRTAKAIGLKIPPSLLLRADHIIE